MSTANLQNLIDFKGQKFYVGFDVHKHSWTVTVRSLGVQVSHFTQSPGIDEVAKYLQKNFPGGQYHSAYEAGFCGTAIHEGLCKAGINNILLHAADIPLTDKQRKNKTDVHDSRAIAENLERGVLKGIHVLTHEQQELRSMFRMREAKVIDVTRANNRLKGFLMFYSIALPNDLSKKEYLSLKVLEWLSKVELSTCAGTLTLQNYVSELRYQRTQLYQLTKLLRGQVQANYAKEYESICSIPGIGGVTTMGLIAEIADFKRFDDLDEYCSYIGFCPWDNSSGESLKTKGLQPRCNRHLRPLLVEAAWSAITKSPSLFSYYSKHAHRNNKSAIIKVARRLALTARKIALSGEKYQADYKNIYKQKTEKVFFRHYKKA